MDRDTRLLNRAERRRLNRAERLRRKHARKRSKAGPVLATVGVGFAMAAAPATASAVGCSSSYASTVKATPGLVAYYRLGENPTPDGSAAADQTGAHPGVYHGFVSGGQPGALFCDSDTSISPQIGYVSLPSLGFVTTAFTIEGWVKEIESADGSNAGEGRNQALFGQSGNERLIVRPKGVYADFFGPHSTGYGQKNSVETPTPTNTGTWVYWAMVRNGSSLTIYRNGQSIASRTDLQADPVLVAGDIGALAQTHAYPLNGSIDEVAAYNRALGPCEILQHEQLGTGQGGYCAAS